MSEPNTLQEMCSCGRRPVAEGHTTCFRCHVLGVGYSFHGGVRDGRKNWNESVGAWKAENLGERINDPNIQPADRGCWT
jgi:hypothetical protein